ncbi:peptidoglycan editing factor PgeF [Altererythrobacter salegens]|uniref:Purine nucleoside phosphorylase n=1 Tax=Croceibacterium salegens TaxID=1737568 RepID=A0A6I4T000_9SPHN|nr:peptidoglycan editing factor PgeF [Croceibacterium salegens]MXO60607.1 peptidoglycan editing factor PgeF [Croceibacterium salegens]
MADEPVEVIRSTALSGIPHGFLGRRGGVSQGVIAGLNAGLGAGDDDEAVAENRRRAVAAVLPGADLATVYQVHSAEAVPVVASWPQDERPRADAMATDRPGVVLGIVTADCAPVLLADRRAGVVGAAHAGWRGAYGGVLEAVVEAMEALGAHREDIAAAIGPAIALESYEVDDGFRERFTASDGRFFVPGREGHWHFDLEGYAEARLDAMGVGVIDCLGLDTYTDEARFFSYRRATHRGEPDYGRQISLIGLPN